MHKLCSQYPNLIELALTQLSYYQRSGIKVDFLICFLPFSTAQLIMLYCNSARKTSGNWSRRQSVQIYLRYQHMSPYLWLPVDLSLGYLQLSARETILIGYYANGLINLQKLSIYNDFTSFLLVLTSNNAYSYI